MNEQLQNELKAELEALEAQNLLWNPKTLEGPSAPRSMVAGKEVLMLCSNNYLGLSNHRLLKRAAIEAVRKYGAGSGSVRPIAGTMDLHLKLEETIARFKRTEDALYYNTGFTANSGAIPALLREGDIVISDELNHGSIIDGIRLTKAERMIYKHRDVSDLETKLKEARAKNPKRIFIITDGGRRLCPADCLSYGRKGKGQDKDDDKGGFEQGRFGFRNREDREGWEGIGNSYITSRTILN